MLVGRGSNPLRLATWCVWCAVVYTDYRVYTIVGRHHFTKSEIQKLGGLTKSGRLSHIITPGVHRVEVMVACGAPHTSQQSCTSSTHQLENAACASLQPRLTCCQTFILPLSALRNWLGKMTAAAEASSNAGGSMGEISRRFRLHMGDTALGI